MKLAFGAGVAVLAGVGIFAALMQPSLADQLAIGLLFALMAAGAMAAAYWLPRRARLNRSLRSTVMALSVVSFLIVVLGLVVAGHQMFISSHDLTVLLIVMGFGVLSAIAFTLLVSGPLTGELGQIAKAASAVAGGDFTTRTGVDRSDEVGELAAAVDRMAETLQSDEEARRQLFAAVGHDLRTPLSSLQAAIEALQDGVAPDPERYIDSMRRDTEALARLVDDVFLLARLESGDVSPALSTVDVAEVADEAVEVIRPLSDEKGLSFVLDLDSRVLALGSADGLARVMRNLLDNAVRHSPDSGEIRVRVSNGDSALVEIVDQGDGFPTDFVARAFESFTRGDDDRARSGGGGGLGLAIAQRYVTMFGGRIWAEPGPGGKVSFQLPVGSELPSHSWSGSS